MLDAISTENLDVTVVAPQRDAHCHLAARCCQQLVGAVLDAEVFDGFSELDLR